MNNLSADTPMNRFLDVLLSLCLSGFLITAGAAPAAGAVGAAPAPAPTNDLFFGFSGPETFPIDPFISDLRAADLDGDGLNDLIVVNNSRSKINLLYNQTGRTNLAAAARKAGKRELNELPPGARFRIDSIA